MLRRKPKQHVVLVELLGEATDKEDLLQRWDIAQRNSNLKDVTFIGSIPGGITFHPGRIDLPGGAAMRSLLSGDEIFFLDKRVRREMKRYGISRFPVDHTVSFDTQFISYFSDLIRGRSHQLEPVIHRVLTYVVAKRMNWDVSVFQPENRELLTRDGVANNKRLRQNLFAAEYLKALDEEHYLRTGELRAFLTTDKLWNEVHTRISFHESNQAELDWLDTFRDPIYGVLMKIACIEFSHRRSEVEKKILALLTFFNEEFGTLMLRELVIATHFFERGLTTGTKV